MQAEKDRKIYNRLLSYVKPFWFAFVVSIGMFLLGSASEAYFVRLFGELVDGWGASNSNVGLGIPVIMLSLAVCRAIGEVGGESLLSRISFSVLHNIRCQLFDHLLVMPKAYFDEATKGIIIARFTYNVAQLRDTGTYALKSIIQDGGKVLVFFGVMFYLNWKLTLIFLAAAPAVTILAIFTSRRFRKISKRIQSAMGDVSHVVSEVIAGHREIRIFGKRGYESRRFRDASKDNMRQNLRLAMTKVGSTQIIQLFVVLSLTVLIGLLIQPDIGEYLSTGDIVTFLGLAGLLARPIRRLSDVNARLQRGLAAAEDIFFQLDKIPEPDFGDVVLKHAKGAIELRNVSFKYQNSGVWNLRNISLEIKPGETLAIVGRSGSGKTTLASMISRYYEPSEGALFLDGVSLQEYELDVLRDQISAVDQPITLFNGSLEHNILYASADDSGREKLAKILSETKILDFTKSLPRGMQTVIGDNGLLLSGGQRQRVAIARALLKQAPILILDEPTSALDLETERNIHEALAAVKGSTTTIIIAHRLASVEQADRIVVLDSGKIVESGNHSDLIQAEGVYAELYAHQSDNIDPK